MNISMTLWDHIGDPPESGGEVLCWRSYAQDSRITSVPRQLEENAERLRAKYLAFIHDLGAYEIRGKRVVDHLSLEDGFSFWWMSRLAEKSPLKKSSRIYDCLRLLALEEILLLRKPSELILVSSDVDLAQAIKRLCQNLQVNFVWQGRPSRQKWSLRRLYNALPYLVQGVISFRYFIMRWPLRKLKTPDWFSRDDAIFLCSYFYNWDQASSEQGRFHARQWEGLPKHIRESGRYANWIHHFQFNPETPSAEKGISWLSQFNRDSRKQGCHAFLETYLSWKVVFRALKNWLWLIIVSWRLRRISCAFNPEGSAVWLWPLLKDDWKDSFAGPVALGNCLWVELFDVALREIPTQKTGLYLWENQGWESALLRAWRRYGHGEIFGVQYSTAPFWYLCYFDDPRGLAETNKYAKPLPDRFALNGPIIWDTFIKAGYPAERLVAVEAMRYQYLGTLSSDKLNKQNNDEVPPRFAGQSLPKRVLILGNFTSDQTLKMLRCVESALRLIDFEIALTIKPHPLYPIRRSDFPTLSFGITDKPLADILQGFDVAFASNSSAACLDAFLAGLPVVIYLDGEDFNHSPLRGVERARFVSNAKELASAIQENMPKENSTAVDDFFWLDSEFPRWSRVLTESELKEN